MMQPYRVMKYVLNRNILILKMWCLTVAVPPRTGHADEVEGGGHLKTSNIPPTLVPQCVYFLPELSLAICTGLNSNIPNVGHQEHSYRIKCTLPTAPNPITAACYITPNAIRGLTTRCQKTHTWSPGHRLGFGHAVYYAAAKTQAPIWREES